MFNEVILIGKLVTKPMLKETQGEPELTNMVLKVQRPYNGHTGRKEFDYIQCVLWKGIAAQICDTCDIGSFIGVKGRLQSKSYMQSQSIENSIMEVKVEHVEFLDKHFNEK